MPDSPRVPPVWQRDRTVSPHQISEALADLAQTAERLLAVNPTMPEEDRQLWQDMLEGEASGDPFAAIDRLVHVAVQHEHYAEAVRSFRREQAERLDRHLRNAETLRQAIARMLERLQLPALVRPTYTASVGAGRTHVIPKAKPEEMPPRFQWVTIEHNKEELARALRAGETDVPAEWSNPEPVLTIRTR